MTTFKIEDIADKEGGLNGMETNFKESGTRYVRWIKAEWRSRLQGRFTADDLRAIADWMEKHARDWAHSLGLTQLFAATLPKPGYIVDDQAWTWIKFTRCVRGFHGSFPGVGHEAQ